jgi:hypothetical protein
VKVLVVVDRIGNLEGGAEAERKIKAREGLV